MQGPIRIQRRRVRGWKMPENTISVTRPGRFGNPFQVGFWAKIGLGVGRDMMEYLMCKESKYANHPEYDFIATPEKAVAMYREYLKRYPLNERQVNELKGKNLACWCKIGEPCHADVLLEIANK